MGSEGTTGGPERTAGEGADNQHGPPPELPNTAFTDSWEQTESLLALRALIEVGCQVAPAVARRAALTHHELQALEIVMEGARGPVDIAHELGVTSAAASGIVDRLVTRGHVTRQPHASDGRRTQVVITDSGREEVIGYLMPMFAALARLDAALSHEDRALIAHYLRGATDAMRDLL